MPNHLHRKALVVALGLAVGGLAMAATPAAVVANTTIITHATRLAAGDQVVGALALTQPLRVTLSLNLRNQAALDALIADPHHRNLTPAEFKARFGPTDAQVNAVKVFLQQHGFGNVQVAPNGLLVTASAPVSTVQSAFHTDMVKVRTHKGRMAFANATEVRIPNSLKGIVHEVLGLQNVHQFHVLKGAHVNASGTRSGHNPVDLATIYEAGSAPTGSSVSVAVITEGSMTSTVSDFQTFLSQNPSLGNIPIKVVTVDGGSSDTSGDGEWAMDTQAIAGLSGGVKDITLYATSAMTDKALVDAFNRAVTDDTARAINVSIGGCETSAKTNGAATGDDVFKQAVAQGQTFSISSGDSGADECGNGGVTPSWPSNSQYVVSVGGTSLYTTGTTWNRETVWNDLPNNGATGGSPSTFEPMPSWQQNVGQNAGHTTRGLPDVAFTASPFSGANVIVHGATQQIGGTSLSAPMFVGVWARALAANPNLGFAAPLIYQDAAAHYATDFHDVTSGNNQGETAAVGWDYTTGFGSIRIANFVANVAGSGGVSPPPPPPTGKTFANNHHYVIRDNGTATSKIKVTGQPGNAPSNLPVHVNITHNWSGDLEIVLYAPNGSYAILQYPDYNNNGNIDKTYSVNASSNASNGTWKLKVIDNDIWGDGGDYGTLNGWSMTF